MIDKLDDHNLVQLVQKGNVAAFDYFKKTSKRSMR